MEPVIVWYLRMSVMYFVAGAAIGLYMLVTGQSGYLVHAHVHLNLLGFMSMMIYGVGYHILPRFSGKHLYSPKIMRMQFWVANIGLAGMGLSWLLSTGGDSSALDAVLKISAVLSLLAVVMFAFNIVKTIEPVKAP